MAAQVASGKAPAKVTAPVLRSAPPERPQYVDGSKGANRPVDSAHSGTSQDPSREAGELESALPDEEYSEAVIRRMKGWAKSSETIRFVPSRKFKESQALARRQSQEAATQAAQEADLGGPPLSTYKFTLPQGRSVRTMSGRKVA